MTAILSQSELTDITRRLHDHRVAELAQNDPEHLRARVGVLREAIALVKNPLIPKTPGEIVAHRAWASLHSEIHDLERAIRLATKPEDRDDEFTGEELEW